ncbi:MAG: T9SS type A sorting domain-containing protein [Dysgonamonadaceae bacterium]|nr:T9SS type A sorting domain-containing protein [Dysgonamonadaceae bacterium]
MKKKLSLTVVFCISVLCAMAQDGIAFWSQSDGWKFDLNGDGVIDAIFISGLPAASNITSTFVGDYNEDGIFDICEVSQAEGNLATWYFFVNDGQNNFEPADAPQYGLSSDKVLAGDFMGNGHMQVSIRRDNEWGLWWLIHFWGAAADANFQFGIADTDVIIAGDLNADGKDDLIIFNAGQWKSTFTPESGFPDGANIDIDNLAFGLAGDIPVIADYDGDGHNDMGLYNADDEEIGFNLYNTSKTENQGYSKSGRGSYDAIYTVPTGINAASVCAIKKSSIPTAIQNVESSGYWKIYPTVLNVNETNVLYIASNDKINNTYKVNLIDISGRSVYRSVIAAKDNPIALPSLNKGLYLLIINGNKIQKIIVK